MELFSLARIAVDYATANVDSGRLSDPIPVLIPATILSQSYHLSQAITDALGISQTRCEALLETGDVLLLVDGFNEVATDDRARLLQQIQQLATKFPAVRFIIASRKHAIDSTVDIPRFEILPFADKDVESYLRLMLPNRATCDRLNEALTGSSSGFAALAHNPLMLSMMCRVAPDGNLPSNRARLIQLFTAWLMQRERRNLPFSTVLYDHILAEMAFVTRRAASAVLSQEEATAVIQRALREDGARASAFDVIHQLTTANLLVLDRRRGIGFTHELVLEYYAARSLVMRLQTDQLTIAELAGKPEWHEAIRMLAGLVADPRALVVRLIELDLILAVRCIGASDVAEVDVHKAIVSAGRRTLEDGMPVAKEQALTALLELGTKYALRVVVHYPIHESATFERALWRCERPEQASLNLLRFGFTGRDRLYACIRALRGHKLSRRFLESDELREAQTTLLKVPLKGRYIEAVRQMELSPGLVPAVESLLETVWRDVKDVSLITSCMDLAAKMGLGDSYVELNRSAVVGRRLLVIGSVALLPCLRC